VKGEEFVLEDGGESFLAELKVSPSQAHFTGIVCEDALDIIDLVLKKFGQTSKLKAKKTKSFFTQ